MIGIGVGVYFDKMPKLYSAPSQDISLIGITSEESIGTITAATSTDGFYIQRKIGDTGEWTTIARKDISTFTYIDAGPFIGETKYYYRVYKMLNEVAGDYSNVNYVTYVSV